MCHGVSRPEEGDDEDDPEYNFLAETDEPDVEDYRDDKAVRITSQSHTDTLTHTHRLLLAVMCVCVCVSPAEKEVNELMEELFETVSVFTQQPIAALHLTTCCLGGGGRGHMVT